MPTIRAIFHIRDERLAPDIGGVARIDNWRFYQSANLESDYPYRSRSFVCAKRQLRTMDLTLQEHGINEKSENPK